MKVSFKIIRPSPKDEPRKTRGKKYGKSGILTDTPEKTEIENQRAKKCKRKYSRRILEKTTVKKKLLTVDSSGKHT
jgi:23S rRNA pseudoU1915 N3-methylase RlmH